MSKTKFNGRFLLQIYTAFPKNIQIKFYNEVTHTHLPTQKVTFPKFYVRYILCQKWVNEVKLNAQTKKNKMYKMSAKKITAENLNIKVLQKYTINNCRIKQIRKNLFNAIKTTKIAKKTKKSRD